MITFDTFKETINLLHTIKIETDNFNKGIESLEKVILKKIK